MGTCGRFLRLSMKWRRVVGVHLVRVITDDPEHQTWVAATSREDAVSRVLEGVDRFAIGAEPDAK